MIDPQLSNSAPRTISSSDGPADISVCLPTPAAASSLITPITTKEIQPPSKPSTTPEAPPTTTPNGSATTPNLLATSLDEADGKTPHMWSTNEKRKLLELIEIRISAGRATDTNDNLKKEDWAHVLDGLNEHFNLNLSCDQIKNQKNVLRRLYFDYKFLSQQPGFDWDNEKSTVKADPSAWDQLIQSHPRRNFGKLKNKSFPVFEVAARVFSGTDKITDPTNKHILPMNGSDPGTDLGPSKSVKKNKQKRKRSTFSYGSCENSEGEIEKPVESSTAPRPISSNKRTEETNESVVTEGIEGLIGAINNANASLGPLRPGSASLVEESGSGPSNAQQTICDKALQSLATHFLNEVDDERYIEYVLVLEDEKKSATFLSLINTSKKISHMWLDRQVVCGLH
ncbi:hypothetical protein PGT21_050283 [Puccinia graminis f. sp. tritici]|uniref:Myb/SANT-like domain-containing protein n=2 Tax=Puccinia graminis f. sp. tritici TaxID=56615 RepID=E3K664_PUCGT|nr:uncharacterized protein PGTG_05956 [Puccinia graminis f. sp. tritici CRL 75-36-700-3]EFP79635.1 hypothetical protein PGTG_05956 [Puccinia graminis f. sp. tritici CRL 75-36-700-3]KAA1119770.1 hypothetical protein PGT21_050283 [Puccinia graminis f. sp. tritici]